MSRGYYIETMGCQMNAHDSDYLAGCLGDAGFVPVPTPEGAEVILVNTCVVRAKPEQKAYSFLGRASAIKAANQGVFLGAVGCLAQLKGAELFQRFPQIDLVMGPRALSRFPEILKTIPSLSGKIVATHPDLPPPCHPVGDGRCGPNRVADYISIMEGCDNFCTYCIVPYVRGREVSRPPGEIIAEAVHLVSRGAKEITLLGQNVNSYHWEGGEGYPELDFPGLLRELSRLDGLMRLRFVTSHPKDLSDELISCFAEIPCLCPHIHLPFQAGSDRILALMRRGYTRDDYIALVDKLRIVRPGIAISSDVMVGFPGETEKDFQDTLDLIRQVRFDSLFSFAYSDRMGTPAERMGEKVHPKEKAIRLRELQDLQKGITLEKNRELEGKCVPVLVEGFSKRAGQLSGRTDSYKIVNFAGNPCMIGELVKVQIKHGLLNSLRGERLLRDDGKPV